MDTTEELKRVDPAELSEQRRVALFDVLDAQGMMRDYSLLASMLDCSVERAQEIIEMAR